MMRSHASVGRGLRGLTTGVMQVYHACNTVPWVSRRSIMRGCHGFVISADVRDHMHATQLADVGMPAHHMAPGTWGLDMRQRGAT